MAKSWINLSILNAEEFAARIKGKESDLRAALYSKVNALLYQLQPKLVARISQVLHRRTGHLVSSVNTEAAEWKGDTLEGSTGIPHGPTYPYAAAHELGHAGAYQITATRAKALAFQMSVKGKMKMMFRQSVTHPPIPALGFVSSTREESRDWIIEELQKTVAEVLNRK